MEAPLEFPRTGLVRPCLHIQSVYGGSSGVPQNWPGEALPTHTVCLWRLLWSSATTDLVRPCLHIQSVYGGSSGVPPELPATMDNNRNEILT